MKRIAKKLLNLIVPDIIKIPLIFAYDACRYVVQKKNRYLVKNKNLKNRFSNQDCFVIGNGSSISLMDLIPLRDTQTFCVNNFFLHNDIIAISPRNYVMIEPFALLNRYEATSFFHPNNYFKAIQDAFRELDTVFFFNADTRQFIESSGYFKNRKINYIKLFSNFPENYSLVHDDISAPISFGNGVVFTALAIAKYMGFKNIYIIGCDVDSYKNKMVKRFYPEVIDNESDRLMSNEYYALGNYTSLKTWRLIVNYFKENNVYIYNAGIGGENDTCPRVSYNDIVTNKLRATAQ
jgi:hypothetical protein